MRAPRVFLRSALTSLFTTALDFGTLVGLTELAGLNYVLATWLGTVVGSLANFAVNKGWAFSARDLPTGGAFGRFLMVQAGASGLHTLGVWLITRFGRLPYPASKAIVAASVYLCWNYPLNRWFVFPAWRAAARRAPSSAAATRPGRE
jgi:putative flippase GtrA